jgi:cell division protein FtsL
MVDGGVVMVMLAAGLICFSYYNQMHGKLTQVRAEHERIAAQISAVQIENERMAAEIQALKSSPDAIERAARQELGMIRPGELVFTVDSPARAR